ncbi:MAG: transposase [Kangiellaceae bacterium]|nr:transposase [Kangiellaceae bacterium]
MDFIRAPGGCALRKGRYSEVNRIYLVTTVTHKRLSVFNQLSYARSLVNILRDSDRENITSTLAWVVMPDHLHWLFELKRDLMLSQIMRIIKGRSSREINCQKNRTGQRLWQAGFHDRAIRKEEDLLSVARYIVANPLRAGLVSNIGDYPHWDSVWL